MSSLKKLVLQTYKKLHRTRIKVFQGDERALSAARIKIYEEFSKNKHVKDENSIRAMIKFGEDVEKELRSQVIQARKIKPGIYEARITEDTLKLENTPYNDSAIIEDKSPELKGPRPCCQNEIKIK